MSDSAPSMTSAISTPESFAAVDLEPLPRADLQWEAGYLKALGLGLRVESK